MINEDDAPGALARKIITAAFKILLPEVSTRVEGISTIANLIGSKKASRREINYLDRRLQDSVDVLAERLIKAESIEFRGTLDAGDKNAAIEGVIAAIGSAQLTKADIISNGLNETELVRRLQEKASLEWRRAFVSESAVSYGQLYLRESCRYLIQVVRDLPQFTNDLLEYNLQTSRRVLELLERSLESVILPRFRAGTEHELLRFESGYLSDIISTYKDVDLFGLKLPIELRRQPVSIAYITLMTSGAMRRRVLGRDLPNDTTYVSDEQAEFYTARVDAALASSRIPGKGARILLTGPAGSGKTTAIQWLAVKSAGRALPTTLQTWSECFPFVVQLRNLFRGPARVVPIEDDLVRPAAHRLGSMPGDWITQRMGSGKALILLDGFDELSPLHRIDAQVWIEKLMEEFPLAKFIVTSRPEGVDARWFAVNNYTTLQLQPMDFPDIRRCVDAWFSALINTTEPSQHSEYMESKYSLLADLERRVPLRELAETPLLCAMLCAFYAYKLSDTGPQTRGELYKSVIAALVHSRDYERKALQGSLTLKEKLALLQVVARHMTDRSAIVIAISKSDIKTHGENTGSASMNELSAIEIVEAALAGITSVNLTPTETLAQLLGRSIVFRQVSPSEAQFAHRSFQEYLAAEEYVATDSTLELVRHIGSPQWYRVISFAIGSVSNPTANQLIRRILASIGDDEKSRELTLLLAECVNAAVRVDPDVITQVTQRLAEILPPRSFAEAEAIAHGGEGLLYALRQYQRSDSLSMAICVRTASLIGGQKALEVVAEYSESTSSNVLTSELLRAWKYFDANDYGQHVLAQLGISQAVAHISTIPIFLAAGRLKNISKVRLEVMQGLPDLRTWRQLDQLTDLDAGACAGLHTLTGIENLVGLRRLNLSDNPQLDDFSLLARLYNLRELYLTGCSGLKGADFLSALKELRVVVLDRCSALRKAVDVTNLRHLRTLSVLDGGAVTINGIDSLRELRVFRASRLSKVHDLSIFVMSKKLKSLCLRDCVGLSSLEGIEELPLLETLDLCGSRIDSLEFARYAPNLRKISLEDCGHISDVRPLISLERLKFVALPRQIHPDQVEELLTESRSPNLDVYHEPLPFVGEAGA